MLGKLLKHELKQTVRSVMVIYIVLAVVAAFLLIFSVAGATTFKALANVALSIAALVMNIMTLVAITKNFSDTLYGRQGYLSFTLPVKCSNLLLSKVIISVFWLICAVLLTGIVYVIMYISMTGESGIEGLGTIKTLVEDTGLSDLLPSKAAIFELLIIGAIMLLMTFVVFIGFVYFSITVANTRALQAHPKLFGIIVFLSTYFFVNAVSQPITEKLPLALHVTTEKIFIGFISMDNSDAIFSYGIGGVLFKFIVAVVLLFITGKIMENKVNVK